MQSAPSGEAIVYEGTPFDPEEGAVIENQYLARRTAAGWQTANLSPKLLQNTNVQGYKAFDVGLDQGVLSQVSPALSPEAPPEYANLYSQPSADPLALGPLLTAAPPNRPAAGPGSFTISYAGASADFSRVFFAANDALSEAGEFAPGGDRRGGGQIQSL